MSNADVAMQLAEDARPVEWDSDSFTAELFMGNLRWDLIHPFPAQDPDDRKIGEDYIEKIRPVIERSIDPWKVDEEGQYPTEALDAMAEVGLFGMRIPKEYGGLGFSVTNYARVLQFIGGYCATTVAYLSAHQSIGVPQPVSPVRYRGSETPLPATPGPRRSLRLFFHRGCRRLRSVPGHRHRPAHARWQALCPERQQAVLHQCHRSQNLAGRRHRPHSRQNPARRHQLSADDLLCPRNQLARHRSLTALPFHGAARAGKRHHDPA